MFLRVPYPLVVMAAGFLGLAAPAWTDSPSIISFSPIEGPVGTSVTVAGSGFTGTTDVQFNGVSDPTFSAVDDSLITATVPPGAISGPISVITPEGTATSAGDFTVTLPVAITDFQPKRGPVGTTVTISGANFTGATDIQFAGVSVHGRYSVTGDAEITASVPAGASSGPIAVVTPAGTVDSSEDFSVDPPNILFVLTDDQRWDELDCMPIVQSELIGKGVKFSNGFVSHPLCAPSRATFLTGTYSGMNGVWSNTSQNHGGFQYFNDTTTIATVLHGRGYYTALIGKYINEYGNEQVAYVPPGWDRWFALLTGYQFFGPSRSDQGTLGRSGTITYQTTLLGQKAVELIASVPPSQPLFLYWAPHAPHLPANPLPKDVGTLGGVLTPWRPPSYNEADVSDKPLYVQTPLWSAQKIATVDAARESMYESLIEVDRWLGQILQALENAGRLENTLVVFSSDNGYLLGEHRLTEKVVPYEESIRAPYIVRWDGAGWNVPAADARLMVNIDFAPTLAAAAGTTMAGVQGSDLLPLLNDPVGTGWRSDFMIEAAADPVYCGIRSDAFTYVQYLTGEEELYDLQGDPYQLQNVASQDSYRDVLTQMRLRDHELCDPPPPNWTWQH